MPARSVYLETFGCQMNELDSELVAGALASLGYRFVPETDDADIVLYNTCSVREHAEQKVWSRLGELKDRKRRQPTLVVGVLGCMAERDGADLIRRMPVVDVLCGPGELDKLPSLLDNALRTRESLAADASSESDCPPNRTRLVSASQVALQGSASRRSATLAAAQDSLELLDLSRSVSPIDGAPRASAYVRITRGCNKFCTYCVVPFTRGAEVHRPPDHIVEECKRLADSGVVEVTLLGQTVNHYRFEHDAAVTINGIAQPQKGRTYSGPSRAGVNGSRRDPFEGDRVTTFADLLYRIHEEVPAIRRLRFVTSYPRDFGDDVLQVMRDCPRICRYIHAPAQSGSDRMLRAMNRGYTIAEYDEFLHRCREHLDAPDRPLMISGDVIVGFPGETDADFDATVALVNRARYKNCFIFKYSPRPGTPAFDRLPDDVPEDVKRRRNNALLAIQSRVSDQISAAQIGREFEVLFEGLSRRSLKRSGLSTGQIRRTDSVTLTIGGRGADPRCSAPMALAEFDASVQLSGRTDGDLIVFVDVPADAPHGLSAEDLVGTIARVRITGAERLSLRAELVDADHQPSSGASLPS